MSAQPGPFIEVSDLTAQGRGGLVLGPISFTLQAREALAVTGRHGAGKSLLLACLAGIVSSASRLAAARLVRPARVAMIFQRDALDDGRSALDNVMVGAGDLARAQAALEQVGLGAHAQQSPRALSGGMRKRVGIARALASAPSLILADEPTAGLDPSTAHEVLDALFNASSTAAIIIATTDVDVVLPRAPRSLFLEEGRAIFCGPTSALADDHRLRAFAPRDLAETAWL